MNPEIPDSNIPPLRTAAADPAAIASAARTLWQPGGIYELRIPDVRPKMGRPYTVSGYYDYDHIEWFARDAAKWSGQAPAIYATLNPGDPALLARSNNRCKERPTWGSTSDENVARRCWLPLDFDPERVSGVPSSESEHDAALFKARKAGKWLMDSGVDKSSIIYADSGNGAHLLLRVDLENTPETRKLVDRVIAAVAFRFSDDQIVVDTTVGNASRIWKVYGTVACKGDAVGDRLHRLSRVLYVPETPLATSKKLLAVLAAYAPPEPAGGAFDGGFDIDEFITKHLTVHHTGPWMGGRKWVLEDCPVGDHDQDQGAAIIQHPSGALSFKCWHRKCQHKTWQEVREKLETGTLQRTPEPRAWLDLVRAEHAESQEPNTQTTPSHALPQATRQPTQASLLVQLVTDAELFHDGDDCYARVCIADHREVMRISSRGFRRYLQGRFYTAYESVPRGQATGDACGVLEGRALHEGAERRVHTRAAEYSGAIYIDLGSADWRAVRIDQDGWDVVSEPPVMFRRTGATRALPVPTAGGSLQMLRRLLNDPGEDEWRLIVSWLIAALRPRGPYPVLALSGEHGTAKSTTARLLRALVDPNRAPLRASPHDGRDLMISATNGYVIALDNLSHIEPWLSDALCRLATGGGYAPRALYTDGDEVIFDAQRPVLVNGISEIVTRPDLLDRTLLVELPVIPDERRQREDQLWASFERDKSAITGALYDAVSMGLRELPHTHLERLPRMADFAAWVVAAEPALGLPRGAFLQSYEASRRGANEAALDSSAIVGPLRALLEKNPQWTGKPSELLGELGRHTDDRTKHGKSWPHNAQALTGALRRLAPNLRAAGIHYSHSDSSNHRRRVIELWLEAPQEK